MPIRTYGALDVKFSDKVDKMEKEKWAAKQAGWEFVERPISYYMDQYLEEYRASGPDRSNLKQALRDFRRQNKEQYPDFIPKLSNASEEELQKRMSHADACMTAMAQVIFEKKKPFLCMHDTIDRLFGKNGTAKQLFGEEWNLSNIKEIDKNNIDGQVNAMRGLYELMDTGDGPEAQERNERVVMLMALNEKKISDEDYRTMRESQLSARYPEDYREMVQQELDHRFDKLFEMMQEHMEEKKARRNAPEMEEHLKAVFDRDETDPTKLHDAYSALFNNLSEIGMNGGYMRATMPGAYENQDGSKLKLSDEQMKRMKEWEDDDCEYRSKLTLPCSMANPYSAILDQQELADFMLIVAKRPEHVAEGQLNTLKEFCIDVADILDERDSEQYKAEKEKQTEKILEDTGMQDAGKTDTRHPQISVYEKDGRKLIVSNEHDLFGNLHVRADVPGQLINYDLQVRLSELDELCISRDQGRGSGAYTNMRRALHQMQDATLSNNPSAEELNALQQKFENLQEKVNVYMERKRRQRVAKGDMEVAGGSPYEKKRISFARGLLRFTQDKLAAIQSIRDHQATMHQELGAEVDPRESAMQEPKEEVPKKERISIQELEGKKKEKVGTKVSNGKNAPQKQENKLEQKEIGKQPSRKHG